MIFNLFFPLWFCIHVCIHIEVKGWPKFLKSLASLEVIRWPRLLKPLASLEVVGWSRFLKLPSPLEVVGWPRFFIYIVLWNDRFLFLFQDQTLILCRRIRFVFINWLELKFKFKICRFWKKLLVPFRNFLHKLYVFKTNSLCIWPLIIIIGISLPTHRGESPTHNRKF